MNNLQVKINTNPPPPQGATLRRRKINKRRRKIHIPKSKRHQLKGLHAP
jgi:hypothetical protein